MEIVAACLFSFICGVVCTLLVQLIDVKRDHLKRDVGDAVPYNGEGLRRDEKLREQWDNFLNYNGEEQTGTDE